MHIRLPSSTAAGVPPRVGRVTPPRARCAPTPARAAAPADIPPLNATTAAAVATVRRAAAGGWRDRPASEDTLAAILTLEKAKLPAESLLPALAGDVSTRDAATGRRWRLVYTSGTDAVRKAMTGGRAGGVYVAPLFTAVQG